MTWNMYILLNSRLLIWGGISLRQKISGVLLCLDYKGFAGPIWGPNPQNYKWSMIKTLFPDLFPAESTARYETEHANEMIKTLVIFHYTSWLIRILVMAYETIPI